MKIFLNRAIEPTFVPSVPVHMTLSAVVQLQRYEAILQNMLVRHKGVLASELLKTMQYKLIDFQSLLWYKKKVATLISLL